MKKAALLVLAAGLVCGSGPAWAGGAGTFSAFDSETLKRDIYGRNHVLDLALGSFDLGETNAFFGVDSLSDEMSRYLTSGVRWRNTAQGLLPFKLGVTNTVASGARMGSQTLLQAEFRLRPGDLWLLPDGLTFKLNQLASSDASTAPGQAFMLGFGDDFERWQYHVGYFHTGAAYRPWGGSLKAGRRGFTLSSGYDLSNRWRLSNTVSLHRDAVSDINGYGVVDRWQFSGAASDADSRPWRLTGQFGSKNAPVFDGHVPYAVGLASRSRYWFDWRVDSAIGWYYGNVVTPLDVPVDGGLWRVSARYNFDVAGLETCFMPSFAIGGSRYDDESLGSRTGLSFSLPGVLREVSLGVHYLSPGWGAVQSRSNLKVMLNISAGVRTILPWLDSLAGPWPG